MSIYIFDDFDAISDTQLSKIRKIAPAARRNKIDTCRFREDKLLSAVAHLLMQKALHGRTPLYHSYGKPYAKGIEFNLSHCRMCAVIITADEACGIDVEAVRDFDRNIIPLCFTKSEQRQLADASECNDLFFRLWTLKESYIKNVGEGLSHDLLSVSFDLTGESIRCSDKFYHFSTFLYGGKYRISYCVKKSDGKQAITVVNWRELTDVTYTIA
ncbi:hypothetical protein FACS1894111_04870 [Clostridia bacterium]|nr:hypothetical protein FACS1894111_04870 [Clostridia bacterium]